MSEYTTSILPQNATLRQDTCSPRNQLIPVIKLTEPVTYSPWEYIPCTAIVVRMQDILKHNGKNFNFVLEEIRNMGSVNKFLGCEYPVILSTIMRDKTLFGCDVEKYIEAIRVLKPKYFMTLDGETYEEEAHLGAAEIERTLRESREVICKCRDATPIGLVKGANARQIEEHSMALSQLGLRSMVFHTGDFLRQDSDYLVGKAKLYARLIRKNSDYLLLYGIGSPKN